tara:strand:+ start:102 stop:524 length:423 start_codon:yes stop_codon:yes gene_type:complete
MIYASVEGDNIAFWIILCFTLPIAFAFLGRILWAMVALLEVIVPKNSQIRVVEKVVYKNHPQKTAYRDRVVRAAPSTKKKKKTTTSTPTTDSSIIAGAVDGLSILGFSKKEAKDIVRKVCSSKVYLDAENLLKDCLVELK